MKSAKSTIFLVFTFYLFSSISGFSQSVYQVKDIYPGESSSNIRGFSVIGENGYFWATDQENNPQIWVTNGEEDGTFEITDLQINYTSYGLVSISDSLLIFPCSIDSNGLELYYSDGSLGSGDLIVDLNPGSSGSIIQFGKGVGNFAYFIGKDSTLAKGLYRTDGSAAETIKLLDNVSGIRNMISFEGSNYSRIFQSGKTWLLKTNGFPSGTELMTKIQHEQVSIPNLGIVQLGGYLFFLKENIDGSWELWKTDGTVIGLEKVADLNPVDTGNPNSLVATNELLFFFANDGVHGGQLWVSDGTENGTTRITNFEIDTSYGVGNSLTPFGDKILFTRSGNSFSDELWISNGTENGTKLVMGFSAGSTNTSIILQNSIIINSIIYFLATSIDNGRELWRSNGTQEGTYMVADICPGECDSDAHAFKKLDENRFIFKAFTQEFGEELWIFNNLFTTSKQQNVVSKKEISEIKVFPNPAIGNNIQITWTDNLTPSKLYIFDMMGRCIYLEEIIENLNSTPLSISTIPNGIYSVCLKDKFNRLIASTKLIIP
jgi:ELWxxDGT repeat protein